MLAATSLPDELIPLVAIVFGCTIAIVAIIVNGYRRAAESRNREQTRREIAAYIAEGSMTPEQGERLMAAGEKPAEDD